MRNGKEKKKKRVRKKKEGKISDAKMTLSYLIHGKKKKKKRRERRRDGSHSLFHGGGKRETKEKKKRKQTNGRDPGRLAAVAQEGGSTSFTCATVRPRGGGKETKEKEGGKKHDPAAVRDLETCYTARAGSEGKRGKGGEREDRLVGPCQIGNGKGGAQRRKKK